MMQNAYSIEKIASDTAENELNFVHKMLAKFYQFWSRYASGQVRTWRARILPYLRRPAPSRPPLRHDEPESRPICIFLIVIEFRQILLDFAKFWGALFSAVSKPIFASK